MTSRRWFVLPRGVRPALAVVVLGAFVALMIVSGAAGRSGGVRVAADSRPAAGSDAASSAPVVAALPDVRAALTVLGGRSSETQRASRSSHRSALTAAPSPHRWV